MEPFPDLSTLSDDQLTELLVEREREEDHVSQRRRALHVYIDALRGEHVRRLGERLAADTDRVGGLDPAQLERPLFSGTGELPAEHELEPLSDLRSISTDDLRSRIRELEREEDDVSLRRRILHGQIEILRALRLRRERGETGLAVEDLAGILSKGTTGPRPEAT